MFPWEQGGAALELRSGLVSASTFGIYDRGELRPGGSPTGHSHFRSRGTINPLAGRHGPRDFPARGLGYTGSWATPTRAFHTRLFKGQVVDSKERAPYRRTGRARVPAISL